MNDYSKVRKHKSTFISKRNRNRNNANLSKLAKDLE